MIGRWRPAMLVSLPWHHPWTHCSNHPQLSQKPQPTKDSLQHLCLFHLTATPFKNSCNKNYSHCVVQPLLLPKCCNVFKLKRVIAAVLNPKGILCHIFCHHPLKPESWNNCKLEKWRLSGAAFWCYVILNRSCDLDLLACLSSPEG